MPASITISITDDQYAFAQDLVERGLSPNVSAVFQHALELLKAQAEAEDIELRAIRTLLEERKKSPLISMKAGRRNTERMIAARRSKR